ncbi:hypothetical protein CJI52_02540, partial [Bifidobacteriaceae bacterium WP022]
FEPNHALTELEIPLISSSVKASAKTGRRANAVQSSGVFRYWRSRRAAPVTDRRAFSLLAQLTYCISNV